MISNTERSRIRRAKYVKHRDCVECGHSLDDNRVSRCTVCLVRNSISATIYRKRAHSVVLSKAKEYREAIKNEVFEAYGGWACACCGELGKDFLSLDHIYGGGNKQKKALRKGNGHAFYLWLKSKGFPSGYQVLCMNCNFAKRYSGVCPHNIIKDSSSAWIETYTGKKFNLLNPAIAEIDILDIAHGLSLQCRWTGQCKFHYSVAQHSYYCSFIGPEEEALNRLLHDASESFMGDMNRPLKHFTGAGELYRKQERIVQDAINQRFGLPFVEPASVHIADNQMLFAEKKQLMTALPWDNPEWLEKSNSENLGTAAVLIEQWSPSYAETMFLERFKQLYSLKLN